MIDFTTPQLSWLLVTLTTIGGGGYMNLNSKVDDMDKKLAVTVNQLEQSNKNMDRLVTQLDRIEEKLNKPVSKR